LAAGARAPAAALGSSHAAGRRRYAAFGNNNPGTPGNLLSGGGFTDP